MCRLTGGAERLFARGGHQVDKQCDGEGPRGRAMLSFVRMEIVPGADLSGLNGPRQSRKNLELRHRNFVNDFVKSYVNSGTLPTAGVISTCL